MPLSIYLNPLGIARRIANKARKALRISKGSYIERIEKKKLPDELLKSRHRNILPLLQLLIQGLKETINEDEKYRIAEALTQAVYPKYKFSEYARLFLEDQEFLAYYTRFMDPGNWHSLDRKYTLNQLLKLTLHVPGDTAECGVYKGASSFLICHAIQPYGKYNHLFDSFKGLSQPLAIDGSYWSKGALQTDESEVHENLREFDNFTVYRGWVPERFAMND
jgi:hypothetical protein